MKIVRIDNLDRDYVSDFLVCENVKGICGQKIVEFLNDRYSDDNSASFYKLVDDDYKSYEADVY